jgi:hypothetical protein
MLNDWLKKHGLRIGIVLVVTAAMILSHASLIPLWIFYTLLIAMHLWIFTKIGIRIYKWAQNRNNQQ